MNLPDFTERCHRHNWLWCCETHPSDYNAGAKEEAELMQIAYSKGPEYKAVMNHFYMQTFSVHLFKNFPVANVANEQPKPKDTMNLNVNITADPAIIEAINAVAAALKSCQTGRWDASVPNALAVQNSDNGPKPTGWDDPKPDTSEPEETPAPKTRKARTAKATPEPEPEPETTPEPAEPAPAPAAEPEPEAPTGEQLLERVKSEGLVKTQWSEKLRDYMDKDIGLLGVTLKAVTDPEKRRLIDAKITELVAAKAAEAEADL